MLTRIRTDPPSRRAFETVLDLSSKYVDESSKISDATSAVIEDASLGIKMSDQDDHARSTILSFRSMVEAWTGQDIQALLSLAREVAAHIQASPDLRALILDLRAFAAKVVSDPDWSSSRASGRRAEQLYDRAQALLKTDPTWRAHANAFSVELGRLYAGLKDDKALNAVVDAAEQLKQDATTLFRRGIWNLQGETGALWRDVANVLVPQVMSLLHYLPIPRSAPSRNPHDFST